jgi:hypothetical protein
MFPIGNKTLQPTSRTLATRILEVHKYRSGGNTKETKMVKGKKTESEIVLGLYG